MVSIANLGRTLRDPSYPLYDGGKPFDASGITHLMKRPVSSHKYRSRDYMHVRTAAQLSMVFTYSDYEKHKSAINNDRTYASKWWQWDIPRVNDILKEKYQIHVAYVFEVLGWRPAKRIFSDPNLAEVLILDRHPLPHGYRSLQDGTRPAGSGYVSYLHTYVQFVSGKQITVRVGVDREGFPTFRR